jgi:TatD DNase family protein
MGAAQASPGSERATGHVTARRPASHFVYTLHGNAYLNLTNRCTLRCAFCPKFNKTWEVQGYPLRLAQEPGVDEILAALGDPTGYREVVFCGLGEPTLRLPELLAIGRRVRQAGGRVRLNTDGLGNLVHGRDITPELATAVDAISISLNAQNEAIYTRHCRPAREGAYPELLEFILFARDQIADITLTAIDGLPGVDIDACRQLADRFNVKFRRRILDEVG